VIDLRVLFIKVREMMRAGDEIELTVITLKKRVSLVELHRPKKENKARQNQPIIAL
jgi:hypothetical protein